MSEASVLSAALRESAHACPRCAKHAFNIMEADRYHRTIAKRAASDRLSRDWTAKLNETKATLDKAVLWASEHLEEPHEAAEAKPAKRRRVKADDGKVVCPTCGGRANPRGENEIGAHKTPWGQSCTRRVLKTNVMAPPVVLPRAPQDPTDRVPAQRVRRVVTGRCHECDKPITGERQFCGRCLSRRMR